ncbi:MAG: hypothetical protein IKP28_03100 [Clostridia bacterium]|nr:hypothetical protein [Clostridia bacterium]
MSIMNSITNKRLILYTIIAIACVIIIGVSIYFQFFSSNDKRINWSETSQTEEHQESEYEELKVKFNSIFNNTVKMPLGEQVEVNKSDETKDIVYTAYEIDLYSENKYDINVNIPAINIDSEVAKKINKEIDNIFGSKVNTVILSKDALSIYNLDYVAYLKDDILSIVIKATLKELDYSQRVIIKTYNYNIATDQEVTLGTFLIKKNLNKNDVYNKVTDEIEKVITNNEAFAKAGFEVYVRDKNSKIYLPENTDTFFMDENDYLYIIYAYGNNNFTSEMDMIIF